MTHKKRWSFFIVEFSTPYDNSTIWSHFYSIFRNKLHSITRNGERITKVLTRFVHMANHNDAREKQWPNVKFETIKKNNDQSANKCAHNLTF